MPIDDYDTLKELTVDQISGDPTVTEVLPIYIKGERNQVTDSVTANTQTNSGTLSFDVKVNDGGIISAIGVQNSSSTGFNESITISDSGGSTLASKSFTTDGSFQTVSFSESDYSRLLENETVTVSISGFNPYYAENSFAGESIEIKSQNLPASESGSGTIVEYTEIARESKTGEGDVVIDFANISNTEDLAVYDENDNLLDYEVSDFDASGEAILWVRNDWVRDGNVGAKIAYGNNSANTDRQNVSAALTDYTSVFHLTDLSDSISSRTLSEGGTVTDIPGVFGGAKAFESSDTEDLTTDSNYNTSAGDTMVFDTWVRTSTTSSDAPIISYYNALSSDDTQIDVLIDGDGSGGAYAIIQEPDGTDTTTSTTSAVVNDGVWHHVVGVYNPGNSMNIYVDGVLDVNYSTSTNINLDDAFFVIGRSDIILEYLTGDVDDYFFATNKTVSEDGLGAKYDASRKGGQFLFTQSSSQPTGLVETNYTESVGLTANLTAEKAQLTGAVRISGSGVQGAEVYAVRESDNEFIGYDVTDINGEYAINIGPASGGDVLLVGADYFDGSTYYGEEKSIVYDG